LVLAVAAGIVAPLAQEAAGAAMSLERHTAVGRVAQACYGLVFYLWKTAVPVQLSPIYELRLPIDVCLPRYIASMALVAAGLVSIAVLALRRRLWWPLVAVGIYAILLLPVSGLAQSGIQEVADRYSYLPGIVIAMFTAAGLLRIWQYPARSAALRWGLGAAAGLAIVVLAGLTWRQCGVWHDTTTLWTHAIAVSPETSAAQNGYGWVLREQKRYDEALQHLRRAVEIQPNNEKAHRNIWATLKDQGRSDELLQAYRDAIRVHPYFADAYFNLGAALQARGDYDGAIEAYEAAVALQPDNYRAHSNLGYILAGCGELNAAREHCEAAIAAHPTEVFARCVLARILKEQGLDSEAVRQLRAALQIDPNDAGSRQLLEQWTAAPRP
jgi:tetratricopeptide (TPR) repeat protein